MARRGSRRCPCHSKVAPSVGRVSAGVRLIRATLTWAPAVSVNNYHGPVVTVTGDHAQLAWSNDTVLRHWATTCPSDAYHPFDSGTSPVIAINVTWRRDARSQSHWVCPI